MPIAFIEGLKEGFKAAIKQPGPPVAQESAFLNNLRAEFQGGISVPPTATLKQRQRIEMTAAEKWGRIAKFAFQTFIEPGKLNVHPEEVLAAFRNQRTTTQ